MKLTKETLKQIIKEELDAVMNEEKYELESSKPIPGGEGPYDTKNFRALLMYRNIGKKAQETIRRLYAAGDYQKLGELASYANAMDIRSQEFSGKGQNPFGFAIDSEYVDPQKVNKAQEVFNRAFMDAHTNRPEEVAGASSEEKPGVMDRIKGFFKEE